MRFDLALPFDLATTLANLRPFAYTFVALFVAMDPVSVAPIVITLFGQEPKRQQMRVVSIAVLTAGCVALLFLVVGRVVLRYLAVTVDHFAIAGGLVLLAIALQDLLSLRPRLDPVERREMAEVVPIGTPLLAGPATITTLLLLSDQYGFGPTLAGLLANLALSWLVLSQSGAIGGFLGRGGVRALSKIMYLLLAAIAVRMVVAGIQAVFGVGPA